MTVIKCMGCPSGSEQFPFTIEAGLPLHSMDGMTLAEALSISNTFES